jgi:hypothetical protein
VTFLFASVDDGFRAKSVFEFSRPESVLVSDNTTSGMTRPLFVYLPSPFHVLSFINVAYTTNQPPPRRPVMYAWQPGSGSQPRGLILPSSVLSILYVCTMHFEEDIELLIRSLDIGV